MDFVAISAASQYFLRRVTVAFAYGGRWGRSVQELVPMIVRPDLIEDVENDQRSNDRQDQAGRMKESSITRSGKQPGD